MGKEYLACGSLVSILVAVTTTIISPPNFLDHLGTLIPCAPLISAHGICYHSNNSFEVKRKKNHR